MLATVVNILGVITVALCALLLLRAYVRVRQPLLFWCGLCFLGLLVSNSILLLDLMIYPEVDLFRLRLGVAALSMLLMIYGLVFKSDQS